MFIIIDIRCSHQCGPIKVLLEVISNLVESSVNNRSTTVYFSLHKIKKLNISGGEAPIGLVLVV